MEAALVEEEEVEERAVAIAGDRKRMRFYIALPISGPGVSHQVPIPRAGPESRFHQLFAGPSPR
jgi:hypothetical protein